MFAKRALGVACGMALLAPAPPLAFAQRSDLSDVEPVVAAGPQDPDARGTRLLVRSRARKLCLQLSTDPSAGDESASTCAELPRRDLYEPFHLDLVEDAAPERRPLARRAQVEEAERREAGGAVRGDVHAVEYQLSGRRRVRIPTVPAPPALQGRPVGELRFHVGELPLDARVYGVRLLGEGGELLAELADEFGDGARQPLRGPARIAAGRAAGERWTISATVESRLRPIRGNVGNRERVLCVRTQRYTAEGSLASAQCFPPRVTDTTIDWSAACAPRGRHLLFGIGPASRLPSAAVMGDGRRVPARRVALPGEFRFGDLAAWIVVAARGAAVRGLELPAGGARRLELGFAPPALNPCGGFGGFVSAPFLPGGPPAPGDAAQIAAPGEPPLYVTDGSEHDLCLAPLRPPRTDECGAPGPWLADTLMNLSTDRTTVAGAVDPRVRGVRVRFDDATARDVATHGGERYAGRYRGKLAFFSAAAPPGRRVLAVDLLDEAGRVLTAGGRFEARLAEDERTLLRVHGVRVAAAALEAARSSERDACLIVGGERRERGDRCPAGALLPPAPVLVGSVPCAPRVAVLAVGLTRGSAGATARLAGGERRRMAVRRLPTGQRVAILVVPRGVAVRGVVVRSRRGAVLQRHRAPVPPAARQCGYGFFTFGGLAR